MSSLHVSHIREDNGRPLRLPLRLYAMSAYNERLACFKFCIYICLWHIDSGGARGWYGEEKFRKVQKYFDMRLTLTYDYG